MTPDQQYIVALLGPAVAALASILAFITGLLAWLAAQRAVAKTTAVAAKLDEVHTEMNGMKTALVKATGEAAHAAGVVEGTTAERLNPLSPKGT